jgi:predicted nucleotide-binding protein (sugar kinase/HSP70/actin superfamily)
MPPLQEWIEYTDWERKKDMLRKANYSGYMTEIIKSLWQRYYVWKTSRPFKGTINHFVREISTEDVMELCSGYLHEDIRGEATLSMGRAVEYARHGFNGVVNLMPFNCMPGIIVNALLCRFSRDYPQVPVLKMVYDGTMQSGDQTRIEAFIYQACQVLESSDGRR